MAKKYYRWKDENCNGINPEWIEMSGQEYFEFKRNPENKYRKFIEYIDEYGETDVIVLEATKEEYDKWNREMHRQMYYEKIKKRFVKAFVSLDMDVEGEEDMTLHEAVADERTSVEKSAIKAIEFEKLYSAIELLSPTERELLDLLFFSNQDMISERSIAEDYSIPQKTLNNRKKAILKKLKKYMAQN